MKTLSKCKISNPCVARSLSKRKLMFGHCNSRWTQCLSCNLYAILIDLLLTMSPKDLPCMHMHCFEWACITVQLPCISHSSAVWCACLPCDVRACRVMCVRAVLCPCTAVQCPCNVRAWVRWPCNARAWWPCNLCAVPYCSCHWVCSPVNPHRNLRRKTWADSRGCLKRLNSFTQIIFL
jgi:hypothetical protein